MIFSVSTMKWPTLLASARSVTMWCDQLASRLHSGGTSSRLQVMMRQPSCMKRATVAWPMPRLAPVRTTVLGVVLMAGNLADRFGAVTARLVRHEHGDGGGRKHVPGGAAEYHLPQAAVAVGAHDQQIGTGLFGVGQKDGA